MAITFAAFGTGPAPAEDPDPFALIDAVRRGDDLAARVAQAAGLPLDREDFEGRTALSWAAAKGDLGFVKLLTAWGADIQHANRFGQTALMACARADHAQVVKYLLDAGADPHARSGQDMTALDLALACTERRKEPEGTPPRPLFHRGRACNPSARWLWHAGARATRRPGRMARWQRSWRAALQADAFDEWAMGVAGPTGGPLLTLALVVAPALQIALGPAASVAGAIAVLLCAGLTAARVLPHFPSASQWLRDRLRPEPAAALPPASVAAASKGHGAKEAQPFRLSARILGELLARRSVALRRELGQAALAGPDDQGKAGRAGLARHGAGATLRWLGFAVLFGLAAGWPMLGEGWAWSNVLWLLAAWVALVNLEVHFRNRRQKSLQRQADRLAQALARLGATLAPGDTRGDFALYLRPFALTAIVPVGGVDLESILAYALQPYLPVVALGKPGEHIGAGRVETDDARWKTMVDDLLDRARSIVCIPSARPGTLWELEQLRQRGLLSKTVFIMPRDFKLDARKRQFGPRFSDEWQATVKAAAALGLFLPPFQARGLLFELDDQGELLDHLPLRADPLLLALGQAMAREAGSRKDQDAGREQGEPTPSDEQAPYDLGPDGPDGALDLGDGVMAFNSSFEAVSGGAPAAGGLVAVTRAEPLASHDLAGAKGDHGPGHEAAGKAGGPGKAGGGKGSTDTEADGGGGDSGGGGDGGGGSGGSGGGADGP